MFSVVPTERPSGSKKPRGAICPGMSGLIRAVLAVVKVALFVTMNALHNDDATSANTAN